MRCFKCHTFVPEGTAICPRCDAILDASILDEETGVNTAPEATDPNAPIALPVSRYDTAEDQPVPPEYWTADTNLQPPGAAAGRGPGYDVNPDPESLAAPAPLHQSTRIISSDPERDKKTRVVSAPPPPRIPRKKVTETAAEEDSILSSDFDAAVDGVRQVYARLNTAERVSVWSTLAAFVAAFLPWYYIKGYGLLSGIQTHGWIVAAAALAALIMLYLRFHLRLGVLLSIGQFLAIAGAALTAGYYTVVPAMEQIRFGLPAAALAAGLGAVTAVVGLLSRT